MFLLIMLYPEMVFIEDDVSIVQGTTIAAHTTAPDCFNGIIQRKVAPLHIKHHAMVLHQCYHFTRVKIGEYAIIELVVWCRKMFLHLLCSSSIGQKRSKF